MLIYTHKLEKHIKNNILPKILLNPKKYRFSGSFKRKIPYVTDIDVVSITYPEINSTNIYQKTLEMLKKFETSDYSGIIFICIICGVDERFNLDNGTDQELDEIKSYLNTEEKNIINDIQKKYQNNSDRKILVYDVISKYYKLKWTKKNIIDNEMLLPGNVAVKFTDIIKKNQIMVFQYFVNINSQPVGFDIVNNYEPINMFNLYAKSAEKKIARANFFKEYYFMMCPFYGYFCKNDKICNELCHIIDKKFGLYKQLMVRIESYKKLYDTNNLNIKTATLMVNNIKKDLRRLPNFHSKTTNKIAEIAMNNLPKVKMEKWYRELNKLHSEINSVVNSASKKYFFKFLNMVPECDRNKFYCWNDHDAHDAHDACDSHNDDDNE